MIILLIFCYASFIHGTSGNNCDFREADRYFVPNQKISVSSLEPYDNAKGNDLTDFSRDLLAFDSRCVYSREGFLLKEQDLQNIRQLNNLEVTDTGGFKSHMRCTVYNEYTYFDYEIFYLGRHKGHYYAQKKFRFDNPYLWLRVKDSTYSIVALAGFYPCHNLRKDSPNVSFYPDPRKPSQTIMKSSRFGNVPFYPTWPHHRFTEHGEWHGSTVYKYMEKHMRLSNTKFWMQTFEKDQFDGFITDRVTTMQYNTTTKPIQMTSKFEISNKYWQGSIIIGENSWKAFIADFLPMELPFVSISLPVGFHKNFIDTFEKIELIQLTEKHGNKVVVHDGKPSYEILLKGKFATSFKSANPAFLAGMNVRFHTEGKEYLSNYIADFQGECRSMFFSHERVQLNRLSTYMEKNPEVVFGTNERYTELKRAVYSEADSCGSETYRPHHLKFEHHRYGIYNITLGWIEELDGVNYLFERVTHMGIVKFFGGFNFL